MNVPFKRAPIFTVEKVNERYFEFNILNPIFWIQVTLASFYYFEPVVFRSLREKCSCLRFFWSIFSQIRTECRDSSFKSPFSVRIQKLQTRKTPNTDTF